MGAGIYSVPWGAGKLRIERAWKCTNCPVSWYGEKTACVYCGSKGEPEPIPSHGTIEVPPTEAKD
jgi:hypothetical protein